MKKNKIQVVEVLINHGADVNVLCSDGDSLLHYISRRGDVIMTEMLVDHGADINFTNKAG